MFISGKRLHKLLHSLVMKYYVVVKNEMELYVLA